jgi:transcription initiation factor TFIIIB Brf1 subunit/transcription initiation factor TFIIB
MKMTNLKTDECAECGSKNVFYNQQTNQIICKDCGAIFEELTPKDEKKFENAHNQK